MKIKLIILAMLLLACSNPVNKNFSTRELASSGEDLSLRIGKDHGPIGPIHEHASQEFIDENLKVDGHYDSQKIDNFLNRLEKEKISLKDDLYETQIIENLEIGLTTYEKAKKNALKEIDEEKNDLLFSYNQYLIPKIKSLKEMLANGESIEAMDGVVDDFLRLYVSFYIPNKKRTPFSIDLELDTVFVKGYLKPHKFKVYDPEKAEASDLMVLIKSGTPYYDIFGTLSNGLPMID